MKSSMSWIAGMVAGALILTAARAVPGMVGAQEPSAEQMAEMMKLGQPGEMHAKLEPLAGKWKLNVEYRMTPEAEWTSTPSEAQREWILGKRFLKETVKGEWEGMPFEGLGFIGYDNVGGEYVSTWMDNMGTGIMHGKGAPVENGDLIAISGEYSCPMMGGDRWFKATWKVVSRDEHIHEMYSKDPATGKEFKSMTITYTRK